jgi:carboxyl-terminal processing protease
LAISAYSQQATTCTNSHPLIQNLNQHHLEPPLINKAFHKKVVFEFIQLLDPAGLYFTGQDTLQLNSVPIRLDDPTSGSSCLLVKTARELLEKRLKEMESLLTRKLQKPLTYSTGDFMQYSPRGATRFSADPGSLEKKLNGWLKFYVLNRMYQEAEAKKSTNLLSFEAMAREKVAGREKNRISRLLNYPTGLDDFVAKSFFKAVAFTYDPHTEYFSKNEMKDFEASMSTTGFSFGFDLTENQLGEISIARIAPGGPAWNSNEIHKGDILTKIKWDAGETMDAFDYDTEYLDQLLKSNEKKRAEITVRNQGGKTVTVKLEKEKIESVENSVKSLLLKGRKQIGYISLPGFYTDWNDPNAKGCATDVATELIKLKKENISGLILDLRFNGGGAIKEAIELSGIFIDVGPLMLMKPKNEPAYTLKDTNRGYIYDGPFVILVNGLSASAAEVVAAGMQDHRRAIIVGGQTFGKSSSQTIVPFVNKDTVGFLKVTVDKVYRISGKSHQQTGVTPDILLPDLIDLYGLAERNYRNAFPSDSINKKVYYTPSIAPPLAELKKRSTIRVTGSKWFNEIQSVRSSFVSKIPLEPNLFRDYMLKSAHALQNLDEQRNLENKEFTVAQTQFDQSLLQIDGYRKEVSDALLVEIKQSPYIEEAYKIIMDYINLVKK